jgi:hypothetical protein
MTDVKQILTERKKEINLYLSHLSNIENDADKTLFKVMKANTLLMLYNLIEAVVSNSINSIRNSIYIDQSVKFDCLKEQIKIQIIKDLKKNISPENFVKQTQKISNDIIKLSFNKESISNGNIDLDKIKELSNIYGFTIKGSIYEETGHGKSITAIKGKRNDLAHGTFSFSEIGKDYSLEDIQKISNQTIKYLDFIILNIENYILTQSYKN